ncbi:hypothetical protein EZ428_12250 [Pedobacter frigiditerrae]|uniref:histidine kinase n=1 Tax=Pedobacter frigiditerrae TaxID=2530452 RepID=A0A4R0MVV6_9SPHI|nr:histidine kinase [Pedobacter frigiditerrae]TCC90054.1 hypothetical protein EZ428_12250 [Pedobacter frigiditerrae]
MENIDENIYVLIFAGTAGMCILAISFILLNVRLQNKTLKQKDRDQQVQLLHQEELLQAIINSQEDERKRIGQDLHDDVGTALSNLRLTIDVFKPDSENSLAIFSGRCKHIIDKVIKDVRHISHNLSPPGIELYGFLGALEELCDSIVQGQHIQIIIHNQAEIQLNELSATTTISLYRVMEELLNNTIKHANAKTVDIYFTVVDKGITVTYQDNGTGIAIGEQKTRKGMGLHNIESRLKMIGAMVNNPTVQHNGYQCQFTINC